MIRRGRVGKINGHVDKVSLHEPQLLQTSSIIASLPAIGHLSQRLEAIPSPQVDPYKLEIKTSVPSTAFQVDLLDEVSKLGERGVAPGVNGEFVLGGDGVARELGGLMVAVEAAEETHVHWADLLSIEDALHADCLGSIRHVSA